MNLLTHMSSRFGKWGTMAFCIALAAGVSTPAQAEIVNMVCLANGAQEPTTSTALGVGHFVVDTDANTLSYTFRYAGLSAAETVAHIHGFADPGTAAGPVHTLPAGTLKTGVWNYNEVEETDILAGRTYVNVHSTNFTGGEIRGQIVSMVAMIDGSQDGTASTARGTGLFMIDTAANTLDYHIIYDSGSLLGAETMAHIHGFSLHGVPSGVEHTLPGANPKVGTWTYDEVEESAILNGRTYVNIHTAAHTGGEIRGQITSFINFIDPSQETGSIVASSFGVANIALDQDMQNLSYFITYSGLSSTELNAHIHGFAPLGTNAGILHTLPATNPKIGIWDYSTAPAGNFNELYVNIHTTNNSGGELRGQLVSLTEIAVPVELGEFTLD